jgi:hypothetical protein
MFLALVLSAGVLAAGPHAAATHAEDPSSHVRFDDDRIAEVFRFVVERSATFRRLVADLDASDCIVYVQPGTCARRRRPACLGYIKATPGARYLGIRLAPGEHMPVAAVHLAHELQHAVEVAHDPSVMDGAGIASLYSRIGFLNCPAGELICWETRAAQNVERVVLSEIDHAHRTPVAAGHR